MMLAFLIDQLLEMACPVMKQIFAKCYTRTATWERLRSSFCAVAFRKTGRNCTATPSGSTPRTSPTIRPDGRPPLQLLDEEGSGCPEAPCRPDGQETCISMPGTRSNAQRHAVQTV